MDQSNASLRSFLLRVSGAVSMAYVVGCSSTPTPDPTAETGTDAGDAVVLADSGSDMPQDSVTADTVDAAKTDVQADAAKTDVPVDAAKDTAPDAITDAAPDATKDAVPDVPTPDVGSVDAPSGLADSESDGAGGSAEVCGAGLIFQGGKCSPSTAGLHVGEAETTATGTVPLYLVPPNNLLVNPGAEVGDLSGWSATDGGDPWIVVAGGAPFGGRLFRGSYAWGTLSQTVDFIASGVSALDLDAGIPLHFGVFGVGWGFGSSSGKLDTIKLDIAYLDASGTSLGTWSSGDLALAVGTWGNAGVDTVTYPVGTRKALFTISSIDGEYWKDNYAASIDGANASVGMLEVRVRNSDGAWTAWQPFTSTIGSWSLSGGPGSKTVQVEFRDGSGVSLGVISDTITVQ